MSRLTGREVANLLEAYSTVYAPQEEVVQESVEQVEEAVDMFSTPAMKAARQKQQQQAAQDVLSGKFAKDTAKIVPNPTASRNPLTLPSPAKTSTPDVFKGKPALQAARDAAAKQAAADVFKLKPGAGGTPPRAGTGGTPPRAGTGGTPPAVKTAPAGGTVLARKNNVTGTLDKATGKFTAKNWSDAETQRYQARAAQNTPKPAPAPAAEPKIKQDVADIQRMQQASQRRQAGENITSNQIKPVDTKAAVAATTKPVADEVKVNNATASNPNTGKTEFKPSGNLKFDTDLFDLVKGHLLDEGYAETEEAALKIMANMGDAWRQEILDEAKYGTAAGRKALAKKIRKGENIGKKGPGTGFKAVEKAAKEGGAEDPSAVAAAVMWKKHGGKKG